MICRSNNLKRIVDLVAALSALLLLSPLLAVIALLVRRKMGSPVLFRQARSGLAGNIFTMIKFRTMRDSVDESGRMLSDEERLDSFGRWLRSSSLDELPELVNVVKGDMSIVGPRPLLTQYLSRYNTEQMRRHEVRPGITGWAQINGRNAISWEEKFKLDVWYVDNWTLCLDFKIMLLTLWKALAREGISAAGEATMPEFMGSDNKGKTE